MHFVSATRRTLLTGGRPELLRSCHERSSGGLAFLPLGAAHPLYWSLVSFVHVRQTIGGDEAVYCMTTCALQRRFHSRDVADDVGNTGDRTCHVHGCSLLTYVDREADLMADEMGLP